MPIPIVLVGLVVGAGLPDVRPLSRPVFPALTFNVNHEVVVEVNCRISFHQVIWWERSAKFGYFSKGQQKPARQNAEAKRLVFQASDCSTQDKIQCKIPGGSDHDAKNTATKI